MTKQILINLDSLAEAAECLRTLAHPHRLRIVELLLESQYTVGELAEACDIPSNIASGHLRLMQRSGMLAPEREGRSVYYRIADPCLKKIMHCIRNRFG
jgi:DNA-binding transcriptional ArsR family regulator